LQKSPRNKIVISSHLLIKNPSYCNPIVTELKSPENYVKFVSQYGNFTKELHAQYSLVSSLKDSIRSIQSKSRGSIVKSLSFLRNPEYSGSSPSLTSAGDVKDMIVLEPVDIIFSITTSPIDDLELSTVVEYKGDNGEVCPYFVYLNKFAIKFLNFICKNFDVIIYSRIKLQFLK